MKINFHFDNDGDQDTNKPVILVAVIVILAELCILAFLIVELLVGLEEEKAPARSAGASWCQERVLFVDFAQSKIVEFTLSFTSMEHCDRPTAAMTSAQSVSGSDTVTRSRRSST